MNPGGAGADPGLQAASVCPSCGTPGALCSSPGDWGLWTRRGDGRWRRGPRLDPGGRARSHRAAAPARAPHVGSNTQTTPEAPAWPALSCGARVPRASSRLPRRRRRTARALGPFSRGGARGARAGAQTPGRLTGTEHGAHCQRLGPTGAGAGAETPGFLTGTEHGAHRRRLRPTGAQAGAETPGHAAGLCRPDWKKRW